MRVHLIVLLALLTTSTLADEQKKAWLTAEDAGEDFQVQGEYVGSIDFDGNTFDFGLQVIARGDGDFDSVGYAGGLPGDGWIGTAETKFPGSGKSKDGVCKLTGADGQGSVEIRGDRAVLSIQGDEVGTLERIERKSPTLGAKAPEGAVVLLDGTTADHFEGGRLSDRGFLKEGAMSKQKFGSYRLHMEFLLSYMPYARGQGRANSGCYHQGRYEVQILDSFGLKGDDHECGGIYSIASPAVNMCFPPLSWQTYDVEFHEASFDDSGSKTANAWMTVRHNGVVIHERQELGHATRASPLQEGPEDGPIYLQDHGNPIRFRNIWVSPIED